MRKILFLCLLTVGSLHGSDTDELDKLRASYKTAVDKALKPLNQTYLDELEKLRGVYTRAGKLDAAVAAQAEIDAIHQGSAPGEKPAKILENPKGVLTDSTVTIPANDVNGYKIGPLKKGDMITLIYAGGRWDFNGTDATENPDAETLRKGPQVRLAIANGRYKTQAGPTLAVVAPSTTTKPFTYVLESDQENVVLRINEEGNDYKTNPGSVTYKLKVSR